MEIICLIYLLLLLFFGIYYFKNLYNPTVLFLLLWTIIYFLYCLHGFGLYHADSIILFYIMLGISAFVAGCFTASRLTVKRKFYREICFRENIIFTIELIACVILLIGTINNLRNIRSIGATILTLRYGENPLMNISTTYVILRDFFAVPVVYLSICYSFGRALQGESFRKWLLMSIVLVGLDVTAILEQACIYALAAVIIFSVLYYTSKKNNTIVNIDFKKYIKWVSIVVIVLIVSLLSFRNSSIFQNIYIYPTGSFVCFSKKYSEFVSLGTGSVYGGYSYGFASLLGLFRPVQDILQLFGGGLKIFEKASEFYWPFLGVPVSISNRNITYNSFVTMFMYFYKDFGTLGIVLLSFIFGLIAQSSYKKMVNKSDSYSTAIYLLTVVCIFTSYIQSPLVSQKFADVIYLILLSRKTVIYKGSSYK